MAELTPILIVDDDYELAETFADYLEMRGGCTVRIAMDGQAMKQAFASLRPAAVILDLHLKGENGTDLAAWIADAAQGDCPGIVFLSGAATGFDRIVGLELHGDEFLQKPVSPRELLAALRSVLRRVEGRSPPRARLVRLGGVVIDLAGQTVIDHTGLERGLSPSEFALLRCFLTEPDRVFSRGELLDMAPAGDEDTTDRAIDRRIARLRQKLENDGPPAIKSVRGLGYRLERHLLDIL